MKMKTKKKQIKDLLYPCYFTTARPQFKEGVNPFDTIESENQSLNENNGFLKMIQEQNEAIFREVMSKAGTDIPDEDFFDLIKYDPVVLGSRCSQEKISQWQREMYDDNDIISYNAESKLKRISSVLAIKGTNLPAIIFQTAFFRDYFSEYIGAASMGEREEFMQALEEATGINIRNDGDIAPLYDYIDDGSKNLPRLLNLIIAKIMNLKEGTVKQYLKQVIDVYEDGQKIGYAIEVRNNNKNINTTS